MGLDAGVELTTGVVSVLVNAEATEPAHPEIKRVTAVSKEALVNTRTLQRIGSFYLRRGDRDLRIDARLTPTDKASVVAQCADLPYAVLGRPQMLWKLLAGRFLFSPQVALLASAFQFGMACLRTLSAIGNPTQNMWITIPIIIIFSENGDLLAAESGMTTRCMKKYTAIP